MKIVTIDGPAGVGKSAVSKQVGKKLDYQYLDTGSMYRSVALYFINKGIDIENYSLMPPYFSEISIYFDFGRVYLNNEDVSLRIREKDIDMASSLVSKCKEVRDFLVRLQRQIGEKERIVAEGRDMGTVVFPLAEYKFFLIASPEIRAKRRYLQLIETNLPADYDEILENIKIRDENDSSREYSPLQKADDAHLIDTSELTIDEVISKMLQFIV
jgi:cytidylate kinase